MKCADRLVLASLLSTIPCVAGAAEPSEQDRVLANALFDEARALMADGRYADACPKFSESMRLQSGGGTLLNLGVCHEQEGKTATAWGELKAALALARRDKRADREKLALERLAVVEAQLSYVTVRVAADARIDGLEVRLDGTIFRSPSWGSERPVDPGEHRVVVTAPGHESFERTFVVESGGHRAIFDVPRLAPSRPKPSPAAPGSPLKGPHIAGLVSGGIGLVGLAFGAGFGISALGLWGDAEAGCPRADRCTSDAAKAAVDAGRHADLSTVGFVVGGLGLGLGVVLFATGPSLAVEAAPDRTIAKATWRWP